MTIPHIRNLTTDDLSTVCEIQSACYGPAWLEPIEAFTRKLEAAPGWSWMAWVNDVPAGYLIGLPIEEIASPRLPALGSTEPIAAVHRATGFYLHDLAIAPQHRGCGVAPALFATAQQFAQSIQLRQMALVAVQDSVPFWQRFGFTLTPADSPALKAKLLTFGTDAEFMMRRVQE
ncbi:GNAT family N-acetyltransferase [Aquabacterium sp.]|uniref:GNAT family N-acetyltransferase n=1 Tax=Aquabacterium sp. TaxID=1872578 RepID=UPI002E2F528A|nr:GNAT family N-acetyltransferase [Aquabacterium sp.]HEX5311604.1 GNAT family N-acetyltransferase [Aquabacterium sp.]